jgi:two-component system OmpR family sensor kinase/two-component system sensor histidine kinase BaeS
MKEAASDIATGDLSVRVDSSGIGEIQALATSFNEMGESLQTAVDQRSQLIADISHELRTPLSLIQGSLEAVLDSIYPMNHDTIESIHKQTLHLGALVDDLRSLSLLDVGEVNFDFKAVDLQSIVNEVVLSFDQYSRSKQLQVSHRCSEPLAMASCDPARIYQVLTNLLGNAMRYTPNEGNISIDIAAEDKSFLRVCVADTGIGIDQESLEHVFDRFYRSDPSRSRQTGGTGLGLAISAKIIEAHGGKIGVNSEQGFGSSFWFTLPRIL